MATDTVNHPAHYTRGNIECIDAMISAFSSEYVMDYCLCNSFKYLWRCLYKGKTVEDIQKAQWYLNKWQELYSNSEDGTSDSTDSNAATDISQTEAMG